MITYQCVLFCRDVHIGPNGHHGLVVANHVVVEHLVVIVTASMAKLVRVIVLEWLGKTELVTLM